MFSFGFFAGFGIGAQTVNLLGKAINEYSLKTNSFLADAKIGIRGNIAARHDIEFGAIFPLVSNKKTIELIPQMNASIKIKQIYLLNLAYHFVF